MTCRKQKEQESKPEPAPQPKAGIPSGDTPPTATGSPKQLSTTVEKDSSPCTTLTSSVTVSPVLSIDKPAKRVHPRKELLPPLYDGFPASGTAEEQKHWMKKKNVKYWWYQKLTRPDDEEYHK